MKSMTQIAIGAAILSLSFAAWAQKPAVYPAKGQSATQQSKDDGECYAWAKKSTGIDPANPPQAAAAPAPQRQGGVVRGAAAGAAVGAIGGNNVGNAAVKGAVVGGVAQRSRAKGAQQQAAAQQSQQSQQSMQTYNNAYSACMSGRGYSVK